MKKVILILISILTLLMSACGNINIGNKEKEREPSTRVPNSVVGKWYEYSSDEGMRIWDFNNEGIYYFDNEEMYGKEDETYEIQRYEYSIEGDTIYTYKEEATLEYTSYGFRLIYDSGYEIRLYEYREDALEQISEEDTQEEYYESIKDENGCIIEDGVLIRYYTEDKEITIPDNVTTIGSAVIVTELENIDKLTIPGTVKKLERSAFNETSLGKVIIEEGIEEIGDYAFTDSYYTEIHIPESVKYIGKFAFRCSELNTDGKIYVKKGSYAEEYFSQYNGDCYGAEIIVEE
ncbi:MAG: leucine-rich repeat domain-containing protein [Lachnospiraceae bacterium]|nr:leucine-rich repeat domain-containing protein [Lachnospiraceae bacterium]